MEYKPGYGRQTGGLVRDHRGQIVELDYAFDEPKMQRAKHFFQYMGTLKSTGFIESLSDRGLGGSMIIGKLTHCPPASEKNNSSPNWVMERQRHFKALTLTCHVSCPYATKETATGGLIFETVWEDAVQKSLTGSDPEAD